MTIVLLNLHAWVGVVLLGGLGELATPLDDLLGLLVETGLEEGRRESEGGGGVGHKIPVTHLVEDPDTTIELLGSGITSCKGV